MTGPAAAVPPGPGATVGVLGGGQLGRMFVHAAQRLGFRTAVLEPDAMAPAAGAADLHIKAAYDDADALDRLVRVCSAVTTEFENVPSASLDRLTRRVRVAPPGDAVKICQHRLREKRFFVDNDVPCAPFSAVESNDAANGLPDSLFPGLLKTATLGYDGRGQVPVVSRADLRAAWHQLGASACVLERRLDLAVELSVIVARASDGVVVALPVQQNLHRGGILAVTQVPAPDVRPEAAAQAVEAAGRLAAAMHYVGVLCVEFFVLKDGSLVANEMAPRPHNSGHYSIDACDVSQFELQVRTLAGLPLVTPRLHSPAVMLNLLGDLWFRAGTRETPREPPWADLLVLPGAHLHLYGKAEARPGRKMGHLTLTAATFAEARATALEAARRLGLPSF